jgi:hypothetical protein
MEAPGTEGDAIGNAFGRKIVDQTIEEFIQGEIEHES